MVTICKTAMVAALIMMAARALFQHRPTKQERYREYLIERLVSEREMEADGLEYKWFQSLMAKTSPGQIGDPSVWCVTEYQCGAPCL